MLSRISRFNFGGISYKGLEKWGIKNKNILYNQSYPELYEQGLSKHQPADYDTRPTCLSSTGALVAYSGIRYGRSPKDKRVVEDATTKNDIWWGKVNIPISTEVNHLCRDIAIKFINTRRTVYVVDGYIGWDPEYRLKARIVCTRAYHALFMKNMLIRPTNEEFAADFADDSKIDFHVFNGGELRAPMPLKGIAADCSVQCNFTDKTYTILGSQYAGEMKKGLFGVMNYFMPKQGIPSLHSSATEGKKGDVTIYFGLSGTGKTTLSADPKRALLGDDEHCWSRNGVFNIEGGCYAKCIDLSPEKEPDIFNAIKYNAILENIIFRDPKNERVVDYKDVSITENTRACYPLEHIGNAKFPSMAGHAKNIIFLTCDAFGVLPPISKLTAAQAQYHFISGYTAKVAGTEMGITDPVPTFSACFGEAFLPLHPQVYAKLLAQKMTEHNCNAWLINTGWSGGKFGVGKRMSLKITRRIIDAIHDGVLDGAEFEEFPRFRFQIPKEIPGVPSEILNPKNTWADKADYDVVLEKLAKSFSKNFAKYASECTEETKAADCN